MKLEEFFEKDNDAFYTNDSGEKCFRGVGYPGDRLREDKAYEQAKLTPVSFSKVFSHVNDFLELVRANNGSYQKITRCGFIELDRIQQVVLDNGMIATNLKWEEPIYDKKIRKYTKWDTKYDIIKNSFNLKDPREIVWMKFTDKGHLGVIAKSLDINFKYDVSSGKLVDKVKERWDETFVFIFPLTPDILGNRTSGDLELAIGNYLISKGVPIIDFYSHNN